MFGSRLKSWMENYIGRPRKKEIQKEKPKGIDPGGVILESSESLAHSDTGISSSSQQVLSSSTTDNREGYSTTTMESERSGVTHCHTAISLPSPESAYSTGYSTDGASPGAMGAPEYYINIRTGKHYFPSPAPTPTSPQPNTAVLHFHSTNQGLKASYFPEDSCEPFRLAPHCHAENGFFSSKSFVPTTSRLSNGFLPPTDSFALAVKNSDSIKKALSTSVPSQFEVFSFSKSPCKKSSAKSQLTSLKLFLKSPKQEKGKPKTDFNKTPTLENKKKFVSTEKPKKWFKQPFRKFGHRREDFCEEKLPRNEAQKEIPIEKNFCYLLSQESSASPRQRNRIKTNPWLPTEPMSSMNFHGFQINFSPSLTRNRSCSNTPLQNRKSSLNQGDSQQNRIKQLNLKRQDPKDFPEELEKPASRHACGRLLIELSDHSEEDVTLNEMMGTYNESYVYEKETDILSDSDPTDCEDYGTDSEAENGGDERDSHDDELDFIDNGSVTENDENFPKNTGKCTYYDIHIKRNSFLSKSDRHHYRKDSDSRKDSKVRREKRRPMRKSFKKEDEERKKVNQGKIKPKFEIDENVGGLNLSRVLVQRMMAKNISKSAEGTPTAARREKMTRKLRETHIGNENDKKPETLKDMTLGDVEADTKYTELIKEAENIIQIMQNSPVIKNRKNISHFDDRADPNLESVEIWKKAETMCSPPSEPKEPETSARKSPKHLGLKLLVETPKKLKRLEFEQNSFKAKPSAHSPLDPLGPALRNFAVFKPVLCDERKVSTSSSDDSENCKSNEVKEQGAKCVLVPGLPVVPIAFQSVDLGKPLTAYCPQSEPVKRKIYSCSKTYDKLVKQFENKPTIFEETNVGLGRVSLATNGCKAAPCRDLETCLKGNQGSLPKDKTRDEKLFRGDVFHGSLFGSRKPLAPGNFPQRRSFDADIFT